MAKTQRLSVVGCQLSHALIDGKQKFLEGGVSEKPKFLKG